MLGLYLRTARYYKAGQIIARLKMLAQAGLSAQFPGVMRRRYRDLGDISGNPHFRCFEREVKDRPAPELRASVSQIKQGKFMFLNRWKDLGRPIDWNPADCTRLWRYNLHYFDYAIELARLAAADREDSCAAKALARIFQDWIDANPVGQGVGWHSYPIARRIVNWIQAYSLVKPAAIFNASTDEAQWLFSLSQQALYLEDHLEVDVMGNHLLTNGKALLFAGLFITGERAKRWFRLGEEILWRALEEQIQADGGHEERSPMYQTIVLQDYLEVVTLLKLNGRSIPTQVPHKLGAMGDFLEGMLHPDRKIGLFADAAFSISQDPDDVLAALARQIGENGRWPSARPGRYCALIAPNPVRQELHLERSVTSNSFSWPVTGYFKLKGANPEADQMIVDGRPMGPQHLPAHGHCSLFSYELSVQGQRVIVDSGVEEYEAGPWRDYWRSTRAHNTLTVDGAEQTEVWASFRAARRTKLQECAFDENESGAIFVGRHSGFATQSSRTPHRRTIVSLREGIWIIFDQVFGRGRRRIDSYIHLHPQVVCRSSNSKAELSRAGIDIRVYPLKTPTVSAAMSSARGCTNPIQGWYAPEFGKREPNEVLCLSVEAPLPAQSGYLIAPSGLEVESWGIELNEVRNRVVAAAILIETKLGKIERFFRISQD